MDYKHFSDEVTRLVRLQSYPIGIKLIKDSSNFPDEALRPAKYGIKVYTCQWITMARRWGRVVGVLTEDVNCTPSIVVLGLRKIDNLRSLAEFFVEMGYFEDLTVAEKVARDIEPIEYGYFKGIVIFPLERSPFEPDVVIIYGTPAQMARLASGYLYHLGKLIESKSGFGLSCLSAIKPYFTREPYFVIPGRGERIVGGTYDSEMFMSFPAEFCKPLLDGLKKTHEKGTRYPTQSYLMYQPPVIKPMMNLEKKLSD